MALFDDIPKLDFGVFREPFDNLLTATANKLEREWPADRSSHPESGTVLRLLVLVSDNTFRTMRYFCADKPPDPSRKLEYALTAPPLARTILDALFTVIFLFEDLSKRTDWYHKAGWRKMREEHDRIRASTGGGQEHWPEYIREHQAVVEDFRTEWNVSEEEASNPRKKIPYWPTPAQMVANADTSADRREFMTFLEGWFYRHLSQDSHLTWPGLSRRGGHFLYDRASQPVARDMLVKYKSDTLGTAAVLLLAIASEIEAELGFGLAERANYVWGILTPYMPDAREIYDKRYAERLRSAV